MTKTLQDRILEKFRKQYNNLGEIELSHNGLEQWQEFISKHDSLEEFILTSIKLVQEETRKEIEEFILNRDNCSLVKQTANTNNGVVNTYLYYRYLILKSITNKEI